MQDTCQSETEYILRLDLPGFSAEEVNIEVLDNKLTISAARAEHSNEKVRCGCIGSACSGYFHPCMHACMHAGSRQQSVDALSRAHACADAHNTMC